MGLLRARLARRDWGANSVGIQGGTRRRAAAALMNERRARWRRPRYACGRAHEQCVCVCASVCVCALPWGAPSCPLKNKGADFGHHI